MSSYIITPNVGFQIPAFNQQNWNVPNSYDWEKLDQIFGGEITIPALSVEDLTIINLNLTAAQVVAALGYTPLNPANNLADVDNPAQALANLGGVGASSVKGAWSSVTVYNAGDVVTYAGATYISITGPQSGNEPDTSPTFWTLFIPSQSAFFGEPLAGPGSSFTLSYSPQAVIALFYNGLFQPPSVYSISGTALTLTGWSTATGDKLYILYYH